MFELPELPYDYNALEPYLDELTMRIHHDKHHAGYVNNLNNALSNYDNLMKMPVEELLKDLSQVSEEVRTAVRNNGGGHWNHSLFWSVMGPPSQRQPEGVLANAIEASFGDFALFQEKFTQTALNRFGSGWAWLVVENGSLSIHDTPNQDTPLMEGRVPILGVDVWEHAYYLKYQNRRADYLKAWWNVVNWEEVEHRFANASVE